MILEITYQFNKNSLLKKNRDKLVEKKNEYRNRRNRDYKELLGSCVELQNKLKASEEKVKLNGSEIN